MHPKLTRAERGPETGAIGHLMGWAVETQHFSTCSVHFMSADRRDTDPLRSRAFQVLFATLFVVGVVNLWLALISGDVLRIVASAIAVVCTAIIVGKTVVARRQRYDPR